MREILFKAKRLDNGEWVEGNIVAVPEDADFMPGAYILPRLVSARADPPSRTPRGVRGLKSLSMSAMARKIG